MNPTAIGNSPEKAGITGIVYLVIALLFFIGTFRKLGNETKKSHIGKASK